MKKIIFGIFAHPDDEAFVPAGTLLLETRSGAELHLIALTAGDAGMNPDNTEDLAATRLKEWRKAGELIGATSMNCLQYKDGTLGNNDMIAISEQIISRVQQTISDNTSEETQIEFMSLDFNGLTGHIDHIVAARATCFAFYKLKQTSASITRLRLACLPVTAMPNVNTDWIFREPGHLLSEIDETVDVSSVHDEMLEIIHTHLSQRADGEQYIDERGSELDVNYFMVKS
jgi:LmbE family N-acetylglucosaminyl deacetylase